jgi:UDP-glucose 4-epimerase
MAGNSFKRACVTGGAGFIGSHLTQALLNAGMEVSVLDDLSTGLRERIPSGARFTEGSILDENAVLEAIAGCDIVFHLAARVAIRSSFHFVVEDAETNLTGTAVMLRCAARCGTIRRFIATSSMAVYADSPTRVPLTEAHPTRPISPYGVSKLACEQLTHLYCAHARIQSTVVRLFNTYGPGQSFSPYVGVVTIFFNQLLQGQRPTIFGDGKQCRDFVHVHDVVQGFLCAMAADGSGQTYNIGSGVPQEVKNIYALVAQSIGTRLDPVYKEAASGELVYSVADISKAHQEIGFTPREQLEPSLARVRDEIARNSTLVGSKSIS